MFKKDPIIVFVKKALKEINNGDANFARVLFHNKKTGKRFVLKIEEVEE